ncbi:MAG: hypothetical protein E7358_00285 [Clostridiales bacterium]|nr:hypothetical protein [Clostridiales bacterium]
MKSFNIDRKFIENKYHKTNEPYDSFSRFNGYHGYPFDESTGLSDEEMAKNLEILRESIKNESHPIQKAKLFAFVLDNMRIDVNEHDYFIGIWATNRPISRLTINKWLEDRSDLLNKASEVVNDWSLSGTAYGWIDFDHIVPDWDSILTLGFSGMLKRLNDSYSRLSQNKKPTQAQTDFYNACVIEYEAIIKFIDRLYNYACKKTHSKAGKYQACLKNLRDGASTDTYEAMQLIYIYFMLSEHVENYQVRSLGFGLDSSLYPFYKNDIESGRYTEEEIGELLAYFLMQWQAIDNYWGQPFYLGGRDRKGDCKVNELSRLILKVYNEIGIFNPKIQIKVSNNTPKDFIYQALKMIQGGNTSIVFCHDEKIVKCLMNIGATYEDALDSVISGCYEYKIKNEGIGISGGTFNLLKPVSFVLDNGYDCVAKKQIGIKTGELENLKTFKDFYNAYLKQLEYSLVTFFGALRSIENGVHEINPSLMFSTTVEKCVSSMTDALNNGIKNGSGATVSALGTAVDALMAVNELVYEQKVVTLAELNNALHNDWVGFEALRRRALNCKHKYGRGDDMSDHYASAILRFIYNVLSSIRNSRGNRYGIEVHSARGFIIHGKKTIATPDGRKLGEETSKNASPHPGADTEGVTALIQSATAIDNELSTVGFCLDVMLHPTTVQGEEGLDVLYSVMRTYMDKGGQSIHFNIFDASVLRDAQAHPEKYQNLQVRVCGWNVLWNNLPKTEQDAYILRAENIAQ